LKSAVNNFTSIAKNNLLNKFNTTTEANINEFKNIDIAKPEFHANIVRFYTYHTKEEVDAIILENKSKFDAIIESESLVFQSEVTAYLASLVDQIPSRIKMLQDKSKEAKQLQAQRLKEEQDKIEAEKVAAQKKQESEANVKEAEEQARIMSVTQATLFEEPKVKAKISYKINVKDKSAYVAIFQYWYENQGVTMPNDKFEKMTIERMVAFVEKNADIMKIQSKFIEYVEQINAK
jgi:gas vesicle protein